MSNFKYWLSSGLMAIVGLLVIPIFYHFLCLVAVSTIQNSNIRWGFGPIKSPIAISGSSWLVLKLHISLAAREQLISNLNDRDKFVAAHVILTESEKDFGNPLPGTWNGLTIISGDDGGVKIPESQMPMLYRYWTSKTAKPGVRVATEQDY